MAKHAGRNTRIWFNTASGGEATLCTGLTGFTFNAATDTYDVTSFGDANKTYVAGLPDSSGDFSGVWDDTTVATYTAAVDGVARKLYLYPDYVLNSGLYWYGYAILDFSIDGSVGGPITIKASWKASGPILRST